MNKVIPFGAMLVGTIFLGFTFSQSREEKRISSSIDVFNMTAADIPDSILKKAQGIAVIPSVVEVGAGVTGLRGQGVITVRKDDGCWSDPIFITIKGGSVGLQAGGKSSDISFVFTTKESIKKMREGEMLLGTDASVGSGPVNKRAGTKALSDIYTYTRSRGAYVGASLNGSTLRVDSNANANYYKVNDISGEDIFEGKVSNVPSGASDFLQEVSAKLGKCK